MYDPYGSIVPLCKISRSQENLLVLGAAVAVSPDPEPSGGLGVENSPIFEISSSDSPDSESSSSLRVETTPIVLVSASDFEESEFSARLGAETTPIVPMADSESESESSARLWVQATPIAVDLTPDGGASERRWISWDEGGSVVLGPSTQIGVTSVWTDLGEFEEFLIWKRMKFSNSDSPGTQSSMCIVEIENEGSWSNCSALDDLIAAVERQVVENAKNSRGAIVQDVLKSNDLTEVEKSRNLEHNGEAMGLGGEKITVENDEPSCSGSNSKQRPKSARVIPESMLGNVKDSSGELYLVPM